MLYVAVRDTHLQDATTVELAINYFYPRDAMLARVFATTTCPSVCPSVRHTPVLCQNEEI